MAKRRTKSKAELQYNKELRRIKQFIRRAEKRGFRFEPSVIPEKPKRITKSSVARLQKITPATLYKKSLALSDSGKVVTGTQKRKEERQKSARKGVETRRARLNTVSLPNTRFEVERRNQDEQELRRLSDDEQYRSAFNEGEIVYNRILDMINDVTRDHYKAGHSLLSTLNHEISTYGKEAVLRSIGNSPQEAIELAQITLRYNPGDNRHDDAIRELQMLITGTIPTAEESRNLQDAIEADVYTDSVE